MKKNSLLLLCLVVLLSFGCGARKRARAEKSRKLHAIQITDFYSFIGVKKGDTYDMATELWGEPTKEDLNEGGKLKYASIFYYGYYGEKLFNLTYDKGDKTLNYIRLTGSKEVNYETTRKFLKDKGINDPKVQLLGMHRDSIESIFGEPTRTLGSELEYQSGGITVSFICYDFAGNRCDEIYVFWNYSYKENE